MFADSKPFMIAVYGGDNKPTPEELLQVTIEELKELSFRNPTGARTRGYFVKIRQVRGDRPARSVLKGIVGHTGYLSCERCLTTGRQPSPREGKRVAARRRALEKALQGHAGRVGPTDGAQSSVQQTNQLGTDQQEPTARTAARQTKQQTAESNLRRRKVGAALRRVSASPRQAEPNVRKNKRRMPLARPSRRESARQKRQKQVNYAPQVNDSDEEEEDEEEDEEEMEEDDEEEPQTEAGVEGDGEKKGGTVVFPELDAPLRSMADWENYKSPVAVPTGKKDKTGKVSGKILNVLVIPHHAN